MSDTPLTAAEAFEKAGCRPQCADAGPYKHWTCVEFDGTGLWCEPCIEWYKTYFSNNS